MTPRLSLVALIALPLALAACATPAQRITSNLTELGVPPRQAQCMGGRLGERLSIGQLRRLQELTGLLHRSGVELLVGTDAPFPYVPPGYSFHQELELMVESGVPPAAVLIAATRNNARAINLSSELGEIAPGRLADLVLLDANPLDDIRHSRRIAAVVRSGILLTFPAKPPEGASASKPSKQD